MSELPIEYTARFADLGINSIDFIYSGGKE